MEPSERRLLYQQFQEAFPIDYLREMPLDKYTNLNRDDSFCYWLETKTYHLGSFGGGSSYKFGIYRYNKKPNESDPRVQSDDSYAWYTKYKKATAQEAYSIVRDAVVSVAEHARKGELEAIDEIDTLGDSFKWKIAFLYSNESLIPIYKREMLNTVSAEYGLEDVENKSVPNIQRFLLQKKGNTDLYKFYDGLKDILDNKSGKESFSSLKIELKDKLKTDERFRAFKSGPTYLWIGTVDDELNDSDCHYEMCCDGNKKASHSKERVFVELHCESKNAKLFKQQLAGIDGVHEFPWHNFGIRINEEGWIIDDYTKEELTDIIIKELYKLDELIGAQAKSIMEIIRKEKPIVPVMPIAKYTEKDFLNDVFVEAEDLRTLKSLLLRKKNLILQGAPGVGKTYVAKRLAYVLMGEKDDKRVMQIQFHQNYSYEDFVMGYKPSEDGGFELKNGIFYRFCKKANADRDHKYFFIIDEINRGNMSKIFGELLMLIENDYRDKPIQLSYRDELFAVPDNLYIIGMMNTADRSLAMIDYALRRRFSFFEMKPEFESDGFKKHIGEFKDSRLNKLVGAIIELNKLIEKDPSLGTGFCIGHSYLCNLGNNYNLGSIVEYDIIPMLREYWFDNDKEYDDQSEKLREALK